MGHTHKDIDFNLCSRGCCHDVGGCGQDPLVLMRCILYHNSLSLTRGIST
jgi:hypothetical protein